MSQIVPSVPARNEEYVPLSFLQLGGTVAIAALGGLFELRNLWREQGAAETPGVATPFGDDP